MGTKTIATTALFLFLGLYSSAQTDYEFTFTEKEMTITKSGENEILKEITFNAKHHNDTPSYKDYKLDIVCDHSNSTLPASDFEIGFKTTPLNALGDINKIYIKIKKDSLDDRTRTIVLKFKVTNNKKSIDDAAKNGAPDANEIFTITVKPCSQSLSQYNYLAYIGTNFDLVDGIKAKNLFFASNIFVPRYKNAMGFSLSMYGNRTLTTSDTSANNYFTSSIIGRGDSSVQYTSKATAANSLVSDNLGAQLAIMIPLGFLSDERAPIQLYYSPSCEFIWRRITNTTRYIEPVLYDSIKIYNPIPNNTAFETPLERKLNYNIYDIYFGFLGATIVHENNNISVRLQLTLAYSISYAPEGQATSIIDNTNYRKYEDLSFAGRVWITEPTTGLTLQAEIFNNSKRPQPYYGVTLSKAFNFKNLAKIFQPLSTRP